MALFEEIKKHNILLISFLIRKILSIPRVSFKNKQAINYFLFINFCAEGLYHTVPVLKMICKVCLKRRKIRDYNINSAALTLH